MKGLIKLFILYTLHRRGPMHGYAIIKALKTELGDTVSAGPGSVYPALRTLASDGLVTVSTDYMGRKIYRLTKIGEKMIRSRMKLIESLVRSRDSSELVDVIRLFHQIIIDLVKNWNKYSEDEKSRLVEELYRLKRLVSR